jgi:hypothetical protein
MGGHFILLCTLTQAGRSLLGSGVCCPIKGAPLHLGETPWLSYGGAKEPVVSSAVGIRSPERSVTL